MIARSGPDGHRACQRRFLASPTNNTADDSPLDSSTLSDILRHTSRTFREKRTGCSRGEVSGEATMKPTKDSANLDVLRAIAVMCVFFSHLFHFSRGGETEFGWHLGQLGVLMFFVHT